MLAFARGSRVEAQTQESKNALGSIEYAAALLHRCNYVDVMQPTVQRWYSVLAVVL